MNVLQIKIHEDGTLECSPDFKIIRGSYRNILMNVEVPHSLLLDPVNDQTTNQAVTGNFVRVAAIIRTIVGKNLQTQKYDFEAVKDYERDGKMYRLYQRIMPKEFTLWATVNQSEAVGNGYLQLIFNVVNWTKSDAETPPLQNVNIEQIVASPILRLDVYAGAFIEDIEAIENPRNYDELKERVDYIEVDLTKVNNDIKDLQEKEVAVPNGNYPDMSVGNATNAQIAQTAVHSQTSDNAQIAINDSRGDNIAEHFEDIENLIPTDATVDNKLADKAFVNSTVNNMSAFYITVNQQGDAFPTYASLINATVFYNGGKERIPTQNDYATVLADETKPNGVDGSYPTTRYFYQTDVVGGTYPNGQWEFQYVVNNTTLTQAQVNAINSGITAAKLANIDTNINKKIDKSQIVQTTGQSQTSIMSQAAISNEIDILNDKIANGGTGGVVAHKYIVYFKACKLNNAPANTYLNFMFEISSNKILSNYQRVSSISEVVSIIKNLIIDPEYVNEYPRYVTFLASGHMKNSSDNSHSIVFGITLFGNRIYTRDSVYNRDFENESVISGGIEVLKVF